MGAHGSKPLAGVDAASSRSDLKDVSQRSAAAPASGESGRPRGESDSPMLMRRGSAKVMQQQIAGPRLGGSFPPYGPGLAKMYGKAERSRGRGGEAHASTRASFVYGSTRASHYRPAPGRSSMMRASSAGGSRAVAWEQRPAGSYVDSSNLLSAMLGPADTGVLRPAEMKVRASVSVEAGEGGSIAGLSACGGSVSSFTFPGRSPPPDELGPMEA